MSALQPTDDTVNGDLGDGNPHESRDDGGVGALMAERIEKQNLKRCLKAEVIGTNVLAAVS